MKKIIIPVLLSLLVTQCATYYKIFREKSNYYTEKELEILKKSTGALSFGYGYDPDLDLDYVFVKKRGEFEIKNAQENLSTALAKTDDRTLIQFYTKIYKLKVIMELKMKEYKDDEDWNDYTYLKKYLLPDLNEYIGYLEKEILSRNKNNDSAIGSAREKAKNEAGLH